MSTLSVFIGQKTCVNKCNKYYITHEREKKGKKKGRGKKKVRKKEKEKTLEYRNHFTRSMTTLE